MNTKQKALTEVSIFYLIIALAGWLTFEYFSTEEAILRFIYADLSMTVVAFLFSLFKGNSSVYDPYWSLIPFYFLIAWYAYYGGAEWSLYQWIAVLVVSFWSWRLTLSWARGWPGWHHEDWRYVDFRRQFGKIFQLINFSAIHLFPTVMVFLGMWGLFWVFDFGVMENSLLFYIGALLAFLGGVFELLGDNEIARFRKRENPKKEDLLRSGIWAYSRNPNYLGELLFWFGVFGMGFAFGAPWYTVSGSIGMLLMFVFASIPLKEKQMLKNRPEAFEKYKNEVSVLIPMPPKKK